MEGAGRGEDKGEGGKGREGKGKRMEETPVCILRIAYPM